MIPLPLQIGLALVLDALLGDPPRAPHPVRLIGRLAIALERPFRRRFTDERLAGMLTAHRLSLPRRPCAAGC